MVSLTLMPGCGKPNAANILLRKENQGLKEEVTSLRVQQQADAASLAAAAGVDGTTQPVLNPQRLPDLYTVVGLKLGRLTGTANLDYREPGITGLKVEVAPVDDTGDTVKAAGTVVVEVTDPAQSPEPLVARWEFQPAELKRLWYSTMFVYSYVLPCKWEKPPAAKSLRVKVRFQDLLTGRSIGPVETVVKNTAVEQ